MKKLLTVVVPAYNAEAYLKNNLDSFCQAEWMDDIEILIVNDGSTDKTLEIAEKYAAVYPDTYRVINKENGGHGSGINCGIEYATGIYFKVVDADDWVEREAFVELLTWLKKTTDDLVYSGFLWAYDCGEASVSEFEKKAERAVPFQNVIYGKSYQFDDIADDLYIKMHNFTIKTEILKKMGRKLDEHCFYVDSEYIVYPIPFVETISFLSGFVYMYRIGAPGQSISMEKMKRNEQHYETVIQSLLKFYSELGNQMLCSEKKKRYIAQIIARVIAGKYKILLSIPGTKRQMTQFEYYLKTTYPEIYVANVNCAVKILRISRYNFYAFASWIVKRKYK